MFSGSSTSNGSSLEPLTLMGRRDNIWHQAAQNFRPSAIYYAQLSTIGKMINFISTLSTRSPKGRGCGTTLILNVTRIFNFYPSPILSCHVNYSDVQLPIQETCFLLCRTNVRSHAMAKTAHARLHVYSERFIATHSVQNRTFYSLSQENTSEGDAFLSRLARYYSLVQRVCARPGNVTQIVSRPSAYTFTTLLLYDLDITK